MLQSWLQPGRNKKKFTQVFRWKQTINFIYFLAPLLATRKKIVTTLTFPENWIPGKRIIQSKTSENAHVSPWANSCKCMK